eukprot:1091063_1
MSSLKLKDCDYQNRDRHPRLQRSDTPRTRRIKDALNKSPYIAAMDRLPKYLRYGPWSPSAYIFLLCFLVAMVHQSPYAYNMFPEHNTTNPSHNSIQGGIWRLLIAIYGIALVSVMCHAFAYWPLASFTIMSWNLFTIRYIFTALISFGFVDWYPLHAMSEILRFPALVCNSITVSVWWIILVPSILCFIQSKSAQKAFIKFNTKPFLLNVHLLNIVLAGLDHLSSPRILNYFDLYIGVFVGMAYVLVYLFVLDPRGFHFYHIILSPRPHWCTIPYLVLLCLFPLYLSIWNWLTLWWINSTSIG